MELDRHDKQLLTVIQRHFPLDQRPFEKLGRKIGLSESDTIQRLQRLKSEKYLRFIGAVINTASLGFKSLLVSFEVDPEKLDQTAEIVNAHPGVSHNYLREDRYNMWFTLALPRGLDLDQTIAILRQQARPRNVLVLPAIKTFKIGVILDLTDDAEYDPLARDNSVLPPSAEVSRITPRQQQIIENLQGGLGLTPEPFAELARTLDIPEGKLIENIQQLLDCGVIRRFGAIPSHRKLGYRYNVMATWQAAEAESDKVGKILASFKAITHSYRRPTYPDWPYSHYSMIHCRSKADSETIINQIVAETGVRNYKLLRSVREFKKVRLKYFSDDFSTWHNQNKP